MGAMEFHPVVNFDEPYWVFDFSKPRKQAWEHPFKYTIGRYNEKRPGMYTAEIFEAQRDHHVGLDIGAPVGTPVFAFYEGEICMVGLNDDEGSYGPTLITKHHFSSPEKKGSVTGLPATLWVLYGHLRSDVLNRWSPGDRFERGQHLAHIGDESENGGWPPHVHIQLCRFEPSTCDLPGVVAEKDVAQALIDFPDPRLILGELY